MEKLSKQKMSLKDGPKKVTTPLPTISIMIMPHSGLPTLYKTAPTKGNKYPTRASVLIIKMTWQIAQSKSNSLGKNNYADFNLLKVTVV